MIETKHYIEKITTKLPVTDGLQPWEIIDNLDAILLEIIKSLDNNYTIETILQYTKLHPLNKV